MVGGGGDVENNGAVLAPRPQPHATLIAFDSHISNPRFLLPASFVVRPSHQKRIGDCFHPLFLFVCLTALTHDLLASQMANVNGFCPLAFGHQANQTLEQLED